MAQQSSGIHFTYVYMFIIKDTNERPDEEVYWVSPEGSHAQELYVPVELGWATLQTHGALPTTSGLEVLQISLFKFL